MTAFLIVLVILYALDLIGRFNGIAKGRPPERTFTHYLGDWLINVIVLAWAIGLLARGV